MPLLIVGAIAVVMLMAGAAAAIMIVMMNSGAFSPVPPIRDTPPVAQVPPPDAPPEPEAVVRQRRGPERGPIARRPPSAAGATRRPTNP